MTGAAALQTDTGENKDVQYLRAQVDTTVEEITVRNGLCAVKPLNFWVYSFTNKSFAKYMTLGRLAKFISTWTGSQMSGPMPPWIQPDVLIYHDVSYDDVFVCNTESFLCGPLYLFFAYTLDCTVAAGFGLYALITMVLSFPYAFMPFLLSFFPASHCTSVHQSSLHMTSLLSSAEERYIMWIENPFHKCSCQSWNVQYIPEV